MSKLAFTHRDVGRTVCGNCHREVARPGWFCERCEKRQLAIALGQPVARYFTRRTEQEQWLVIDSTTGYTHGSFSAEGRAEHVAEVLEAKAA